MLGKREANFKRTLLLITKFNPWKNRYPRYCVRVVRTLTELPHAISNLISDKPSTFNNIELIMS